MMYCVNTYVATFFFIVNKHEPKQYLHVGVKKQTVNDIKKQHLIITVFLTNIIPR